MKTLGAHSEFKAEELNQEYCPFLRGQYPFLQTLVCYTSQHNLTNFLKLKNIIIKWLEY